MSGPERREQLLDTTLALIADAGFTGVSIDAIARAAGISRPIIYGHFQDLPGVLHALLDREHERTTGQLAAVLPRVDDDRPLQEIALDGLQAFLDAVAAAPLSWRLVLMPVEGAPPILHERVTQGRADARTQLAAVAAAGLRRAGVDPAHVDLELLAHVAQGFSEHAARLVITEPGAYPVTRIVALAHQGAALLAAIEATTR